MWRLVTRPAIQGRLAGRLTAPGRPAGVPALTWCRTLCSGSSSDDGAGSGNGGGNGAVSEADAEPVPGNEFDESTAGGLVRVDPENISTMPPVTIFPFSNRPLFPGVFQPCEVTNESLAAAIVAAKASHHPYVGVFLPRPDEDGKRPELAMVSEAEQVHDVGTLAQISRVTQTPRGVQLLLLGGRRVRIGKVLQREPVMLVKVEDAAETEELLSEDVGYPGTDEGVEAVPDPSLEKAYCMEVMQTIKEILKLNPFFKEQMQAGRDRRGAASRVRRQRGRRPPHASPQLT